MFGFFCRASVHKLLAVIIRWLFYCARYFGMLCCIPKSRDDDQLVMEESSRWWKCAMTFFRIGCLCISTYSYIVWIISLNDWILKCLNFARLLMNIACCLCLLRLHIFQGRACTQLVNRLLQLSQRVQNLSKGKHRGFGGTYELVFLILTVVCIIYDGTFLIRAFALHNIITKIHLWIPDAYISMSSKLLTFLAVVGYLTLGILYADLNTYFRTELRSHLNSLEEQYTRQRLRRAHKILDLHKDLQSWTTGFHRIYELPLFLSLARNCIGLVLVSYNTFIRPEIGIFWHWSLLSIETLCIFLLTLSVQRARFQFGRIRSLMLESFYLNANKEWHRTLEMFLTQLNLYQLRVRPLGLFNVSNELMLIFLSAVVTYITVIIQYGMQMEALALSLSKGLN